MTNPKETQMSNKDDVKQTASQNIVRQTKVDEGDDRLGRASSDAERNLEDGTILSMDERKALLRKEWDSDVLPSVPNDSKYHYCWLSTNNQNDPIYRRLRLGYELVKKEDMPVLHLNTKAVSAEYEGLISINEMILARIPLDLYQELMLINHHERPLEEEELLQANAVLDEEDSEGKNLGQFEGDGIKRLAKRTRRPTFI
jgi:hypothetical protein